MNLKEMILGKTEWSTPQELTVKEDGWGNYYYYLGSRMLSEKQDSCVLVITPKGEKIKTKLKWKKHVEYRGAQSPFLPSGWEYISDGYIPFLYDKQNRNNENYDPCDTFQQPDGTLFCYKLKQRKLPWN